MKKLILTVLLAAFANSALAAVPDTIVILGDDLRYEAFKQLDSLNLVPKFRARFVTSGMTFERAYAHPICGPSRSMYLLGKVPHNSGVTTNANAIANFNQAQSVTCALSDQYRILVGKWLNLYPGTQDLSCWDNQHVLIDGTNSNGTSSIYNMLNWKIREGGAIVPYTTYQTSTLTSMATAAISAGLATGKPIFLQFSPPVPHFELSEIDLWTFQDGIQYPDSWRLYIRPDPAKNGSSAWNTILAQPLSSASKPSFNSSGTGRVLNRPTMTSTDIAYLTFQDKMELLSLLSVEDSIGAIETALGPTRAAAAHWIFFGDNGLMKGEHGQSNKQIHDEESIRVPFYISGPGVANATSYLQVSPLDLAPTIREWAGLSPDSGHDGRSLVSLLSGAAPSPWRLRTLIDYTDEPSPGPLSVASYRALRTSPTDSYPSLLGVEWAAGGRERFNMLTDQHAQTNIYSPGGAAELWITARISALATTAGSAYRTAEE